MSDYQGNIVIKNPAVPTGPSAFGRAPGMWKLSEVAYWVKQGVWPNPAIVPDPQFPYVSLLLSTTALGNANNNLFVDSSGAFNPVSRFGDTTQGSFTPYSANWSNFFDGNEDYFTVPYTAANFDWWSVDFTIEYWFFANSAAGISYFDAGINHSTVVGNRSATSPTDYWSFGPTDAGTVTFYYFNGSGNGVTSTATYSLNAWNHVAMTKTSSGITVFVNGVAGTTTAISGTPQSSTGVPLTVGQGNNTSFNGYVSNLRIVRGTAIYSGNFTPPTAPLTAVTSTTLLTCQSNRFRDASSNNLTLTVTNNTSVQDFGPFSPAYPGAVYNQSDITNWSGYFDGVSNQYLSVANNSALDLPSNLSFTIEGWIYPTRPNNGAQSGFRNVVSKRVANSLTSNYNIMLWFNSEKLGFYNGSTSSLSNGSVQLNAWTHFAYVYDGASSLKLYLNGTLDSTFAVAPGATNSAPVTIGSLQDDTGTWDNFGGSISNIRIVKGSQVYTSNFTPPTSPLTAISGTSLLTLQNAAFTDNSTNNFAITPFGDATVTGNSPFNTVGYWSNYFDGSGDYLSTPSNTAFQFGTGDFTVEFWINAAASGSYTQTIGTLLTGTEDGTWRVGNRFNNGNEVYFARGNGGGYDEFRASVNVNDGAWHHVAVTRASGTVRIFIDGALGATSAIAGTCTSSNELRIGYNQRDNAYLSGYLSNVRIIKGTALYTAAFTPPSAPLTAVSGTTLLTCQSSRIADASSSALTLTRNGDVSVQSFDPFYTSTAASNGGSMYFAGSGNYLYSAPSPAYNFGSGNFTIEGWFYFTNATANSLQTLYSNYTSFSSAGSIFFGKHSSVNSGCMSVWFSSYTTGSPLLAETTYPPNNAWTHYALVRNGNTFTLYRNGVATASATWTGPATSGACPAFIGAAGDAATSYNFPGYMSDFRITKGAAVYTSNFTPPTAPLAPAANTTLLLNGMNAGVFDAATINDIGTAGNARVSTAVSKFGGSSVYFDGNGDFLSVPSTPNLTLGSRDFTIEFWLYLNSTSGTQVFYDQRTGFGAFPVIYMEGTTVRYFVSGADRITGAALSPNTWYHIAVSRSGTSTRMFVNGTQSGSTYSDGTNYLGGVLFVGADKGPGNFMNGYMDDLRVTKGVARYTANFTPPTQAFPIY